MATAANRVSNAYIEVITSGQNPVNRVTDVYIEMIGSGQNPANRVSDVYLEVIGDPRKITNWGALNMMGVG